MIYLLFAGEGYYACGGMNDFKQADNDPIKLVKLAATRGYDWWHIICKDDLSIFAKSDIQALGTDRMSYCTRISGEDNVRI